MSSVGARPRLRGGSRARLVASSLVLASCAVGPDFVRPSAPRVAQYTPQSATSDAMVADGQSQRLVPGADVDPEWWRLFGSQTLDAIVREALASSPTLAAARATLARSEHILAAGYGVFSPQLDARASLGRQKYNPAPGKLPSRTYNLLTAAGSVSYVIDVWGAERRQVEALRANRDQARYAVAAAYVMLSANVVNTAIAQAAYRAQLEATRSLLARQRDQLRITEAQVEGGTVPYVNVLTMQSQIASTEAALPPLEQKIDQATHLLAVLEGITPAEWRRAPIPLDELRLPLSPPLTVPSTLVSQRPDILMAEATAHAANASVGVATAAMLPNVTLSANYGANATSPGELFNPASVVWNAAAGLTQPLFHGAALAHQRKAAVAARDAVLADYRQTVLSAFEQVADALRALEHDAQTLEAQTEALQTAERALHLLQANYAAGIANYLQVLAADDQYLQARVGYVQATAQRLQDTVALYVALGGGWWNAPADRLVPVR